jgi:hypothetical protein
MDRPTAATGAPLLGRDRRFVAARRAASDRLRAIVVQAIDQAEQLEVMRGIRARRRKAKDAAKFALAVEALISDAAFEAGQKGRNARLRLSLDRTNLAGREPPAVGDATRQALHALSAPEIPWLSLEVGTQGEGNEPGRETTFAAGPRLLDHTVGAADTSLDYSGEELVRLRDVPPPRLRKGQQPKGRKKAYTDNQDTHRLREEMRSINAAISKLTIESITGYGEVIEPRPPCLVRRFTQGTFECGGRLWDAYGAPFWYSLPTEQRLDRILIDGERVGEADIKTCSAAILYARSGLPMPQHDPYLPAGFEPCHRPALKKIFQAALNFDGRLGWWPSDLSEAERPCDDFETVMSALENHNASIAHVLGQPRIGHEVQRTESNIIVRALLAAPHLKALPLHDCLLVPEQHVEEAAEVLRDAFKAETGGDCRVDTKLS